MPDSTRLAIGAEAAEYRVHEWKVTPVVGKSPDPAPLTAEQRKTLEWVIGNGGSFTCLINGNETTVSKETGSKIPDEPLILVSVSLKGVKACDDAAVQSCRSLAGLSELILDGTPITDQALPALKQFTALKHLSLMGTKVTDAGLAQLAGYLFNIWPSATAIKSMAPAWFT